MIKLVNSVIFTTLLGLCQSSLGMEQELKPERPEAVADITNTLPLEIREQIATERRQRIHHDRSNNPAYNVVADGTAAQILRGPVGWIALGANPELARLLRQNHLPITGVF